MDGPDPEPAERQWPPDEPLDPETALAARCGGCGAPWRVHRDLAGFRVRCSCGTYVEVPRLPDEPRALGFSDDWGVAKAGAELPAPAPVREDDQGRLELTSKPGQVIEHDLPTAAPLAPGALQHGNLATQKRWTNAAFIELALMMSAFLLPSLAIQLVFDGEARTLAWPFASLVTGVSVVLIAAALSPFAFSGMRRAAPRFFVEALAVAGVFLVLAELWMGLVDVDDQGGAMLRALRGALGPGWFLFVLAFCPAVFEEIAFRGAVQGRFSALLGRFHGIVATGAAFGICHGITAALPFHVGIGIYLCWLRERSKSLLPCMLAHGAYNATIGLMA